VRNCGVRRISAPPCAASAPTAHRESTRRAMSARAPSCLAQGPPNFLCRGPTCFDALCFAFCENGTERGIRSILLTGAALCASPYDAFDPMLLARCQSRNRLAVVNLRAAPMTALQFLATFCRCLEPVLALDPLQRAFQTIDIHQNGRVTEIGARLRHCPDANYACAGCAPSGSADPKPGSPIRDEHLINILIAAFPPIVRGHPSCPSSCLPHRVASMVRRGLIRAGPQKLA
jgi:hypothetical protein